MTLLALERVCKRHQDARSERVVLDDLSMSLHAGELVAILGERGSGRSTLLRIAAGIQAPDSGVVRFAGAELAPPDSSALGDGIGYCSRASADREAGFVLEELMLAPRIRGVRHSDAQARARAALERVGAAACAGYPFNELDGAESVRVGLAQALVLQPALLVIDEPVTGVDPPEHEGILELLRSLADDGIAVLMSVGESTEFPNADRKLLIRDGVLAGSVDPELPSVHQLLAEASA
ncbi:MAG TPA: ATP-binding cassette domain-containing protein [Solirubrobacteraceae bacterium]